MLYFRLKSTRRSKGVESGTDKKAEQDLPEGYFCCRNTQSKLYFGTPKIFARESEDDNICGCLHNVGIDANANAT